MELILEPMIPKPFVEGDDGSYYKWLPSDFPLLAQNKVAAGRLLLHPRGFAIPHYADCSKVGYILQGDGVAGFVFPNKADEVVVKLRKGDLIPVTEGVSSWWFNDGGSDFEVIFLGDTKNGHVSGDMTYFILTGPLGILQGFSPEYVGKTYSLNEEETSVLLKSQAGGLIIKLEPGKTLPQPHEHSKLVYNIDNAVPDFRVNGGGSVTAVTKSKFPFIGQSGLTAIHEKLDANAVRSPVYGAEPSVQLIYVVRGSGNIQIVGFSGKTDADVKAGQLIFVPRYFVVGKIAGEEGLECFSITTTTQIGRIRSGELIKMARRSSVKRSSLDLFVGSPLVEELGGKTSVFEALCPEVLQISFNITAEFEKLFRSKITKTSPLVPPTD